MSLFLTGDHRSHRRLRVATGEVVDAVARWAFAGPGPWSGIDPCRLARDVAAIDPCPAEGVDLAAVLDELGPVVLAHGVRPAHAWCAAHLQCPPLLASAAAEVAIAATNQSMDSFDQAPAATLVEDHLLRWLGGLLGLPATAAGVLTSGGTASNLLALYLARERAAPAPVRVDGLPADARRWRIVTSEAAHFSVAQAAGVLGLGQRAVATVAVDRQGRVDVAALDHVLAGLAADGLVPIALVATAGTTDHGAIDPLAAMADRAAAVGAWFHVDAAVAGALALSDRLRPALAGLERADSVTVDFHKLWWQPIAASALVVADGGAFAPARHATDYLDRPEDAALNLVSRSLETSRRFDAFKVVVGLRTTGRRQLAAMVEHVVDLARLAADEVAARPDLELLAPPSTVTVLFRWCGADGADGADGAGDLDRVNTEIQRRLFASGRAVVGRTRVGGQVALKLTFVNPLATVDDVRGLLDEIHP